MDGFLDVDNVGIGGATVAAQVFGEATDLADFFNVSIDEFLKSNAIIWFKINNNRTGSQRPGFKQI